MDAACRLRAVARSFRTSQRRAQDTLRFVEPRQAHPGVAHERGDVDQQAIAAGTHGIALGLVEHRLRVPRPTPVKKGAGQQYRAIGGVGPTRPTRQATDSLSKVSNARRVAACCQLEHAPLRHAGAGWPVPPGQATSRRQRRHPAPRGRRWRAVPPVHGGPLRGPRRARRRMPRGISIDDRAGPERLHETSRQSS